MNILTDSSIIQRRITAMFLSGLLVSGVFVPVYAESLFRAGIAYQTAQPYTPRSIFAVPRPSGVGDMVTISINQTTKVDIQNNNTIGRKQEITENNTSFFNDIIKGIFNTDKNYLPSVDGIENENSVTLSAAAQKKYSYTDRITCQVIQVLPNGNLVVQGRKTIFANQEQQDLYVSGIVNPYYLDAQNTVDSNLVANLQMNVTGRGTISRQQGDGMIGKYFQFFK